MFHIGTMHKDRVFHSLCIRTGCFTEGLFELSKYSKDNKDDKLLLASEMCTDTVVLGHYLFLQAHSCLRQLFTSRNR